MNQIYQFVGRVLENNPMIQKISRWLLLTIIAPCLRWFGYGNRRRESVLYAGQAYYNSWYLSRELRKLGWKADLLNWDLDPDSQIYYHGEDFTIPYTQVSDWINFLKFYIKALKEYDIFHFANKGGMQFGGPLQSAFKTLFGEEGFEIRLLKALGKKVVYSNNGCLDGVSQSQFARWGPQSVCSICCWQDRPEVCSDEGNLAWGKFRNSLADYQCLLGGNRVDYNVDPTVHEVPEFYCLDAEFWHPDLEIPSQFQIPKSDQNSVYVYHAVGNRDERTCSEGINIKSSHVYLPLIEKLRDEGIGVELISPSGVPNKDVRFYQAQADIFLEMLTYGWFGANAREAMMLGKPVICFLRSEWLDQARVEIPEYIDELPVISATPETVESILRDLIRDRAKREEIGRCSREFAVKWHSSTAAARRFSVIYRELLSG